MSHSIDFTNGDGNDTLATVDDEQTAYRISSELNWLLLRIRELMGDEAFIEEFGEPPKGRDGEYLWEDMGYMVSEDEEDNSEPDRYDEWNDRRYEEAHE